MAVSIRTAPAVYTAQDLERLSDAGHHYELIKGELRPMSPSGSPQGDATSRVSFYVNGVVYGEDLGMTFAAETGFFVERDSDTVKASDFAFTGYERLPDPLPDGYVPLVPDLAVETHSPNDTARGRGVGRGMAVGRGVHRKSWAPAMRGMWNRGSPASPCATP